MKRLVTVVVILVGTTVVGGAASADVLVLQTGGRERGVIIKEGPDGYWLQTGARMKVLYSPAEVQSIERESPEVNAALQAKWADGTQGARPADRPAAVAPTRSDAPDRRDDLDDDSDDLDTPQEEILPEERYDFILGGGFVVGETTQAEVRRILGNPDKTKKEDAATVWIYGVGGDDAYALTFERVDKKGVVLVHALYMSNHTEAERRDEAMRTFKAIEGHQ